MRKSKMKIAILGCISAFFIASLILLPAKQRFLHRILDPVACQTVEGRDIGCGWSVLPYCRGFQS
jgi:hypothetical protein